MIDLGHMFGDSGEFGNSRLAHYVLARLSDDYLIMAADLKWLDECDGFAEEPLTNKSATEATKAKFTANPTGHIDPFVLLIDAEICDGDCQVIESI